MARTIFDESGSGYHGEHLGGCRNTASVFAGSTASRWNGDRYGIAPSSYVSAVNPSAPLTVECWAKLLGVWDDWRCPIGIRNDASISGTQSGFNFYAAPSSAGAGRQNKWEAWHGYGVAGAWEAITGPDWVLDTWTYLAWTHDGTTARFYVDGSLVGSASRSYTKVADTESRSWGLGALTVNNADGVTFADSRVGVAHAAITARQRSSAEISSRYAITTDADWQTDVLADASLVAYWPLGDCSGPTVGFVGL